ncbi:hypothetical protein SVIO_072150 [Streptomyces violaceusniger]|uniref:DUF7008 domain-containing protein n=1 Tax=Streptomyces violaceusniger TaxID=68280 RepID=A0A4D4L606_STRVO|nr:hypothetical protein SVIO_072150 [Streptomyces violaceusniger]
MWRAIVRQLHDPGSESEWVSVSECPSREFSEYPWSLSGGGAGKLADSLTGGPVRKLGQVLGAQAGFAGFSGADDVFYLSRQWHKRFGTPSRVTREVATGDELRDWNITPRSVAITPYGAGGEVLEVDFRDAWAKSLWRVKQPLGQLADFAGKTRFEAGIPWWSWYRWTYSRVDAKRTIVLAKVATHNHAAINDRGIITTQHMPAIAANDEIPNEELLAIVALLNSSAACFLLKQVCYPKGGDPVGGDGARVSVEAWSDRYEFSGVKFQEFPVPEIRGLGIGSVLDLLAKELSLLEPSAVYRSGVPDRAGLVEVRAEYTHIRQRLIALQEELDWQVYGLYGVLSDKEIERLAAQSPAPSIIPAVNPGERAFEIVLARKVARGETETAWFDRHGSTPITEIPSHWPDWYRDIVQARIDIIERRKDIALIERPECKRRWASEPWEKKEKVALRTWLLDRVEEPGLWYGLRDGMKQPRALTVSQLADVLRDDRDFNSVAQLYATDHMGKPDIPLADVLAEIVADEHVPYLAAMRYKDSGLRNREQWEQVWEMQREEDRTGQRLDIPVPPKYKGADFQKHSYWSNRGKLDVPKERFISYLEASPDADSTTLLGWAGWDHKDQAQALFNLIDDRTKEAGWGTDRIKPLLAGVLEVMPWVRQWHGEYDEEWEGVPADEYQAYFEELCAKHQVSEADLRAWRPEKKVRGRKKAATKKAEAEQPVLNVE